MALHDPESSAQKKALKKKVQVIGRQRVKVLTGESNEPSTTVGLTSQTTAVTRAFPSSQACTRSQHMKMTQAAVRQEQLRIRKEEERANCFGFDEYDDDD